MEKNSNINNVESSFDDLFGTVHRGDYNCSSKGLKSLVDLDIPDIVTGDFYCHLNELTSLKGAPTVGGGFFCDSNMLTSLEGAPKTISGSFYCSSNKLTSLEGAPTTVSRDFNCSSNQKLSSLKGHPKEVKENFYLRDCPLITPKMIEDLKKNCKIGGKIIT